MKEFQAIGFSPPSFAFTFCSPSAARSLNVIYNVISSFPQPYIKYTKTSVFSKYMSWFYGLELFCTDILGDHATSSVLFIPQLTRHNLVLDSRFQGAQTNG